MKDQEGFPLDMAYEICKERRACPDWCEAMADALSQSYTKYETLTGEMEMLLGGPLCAEVVQKFEELMCLIWSAIGDKSFESIQAAAGKILEMKKANGPA